MDLGSKVETIKTSEKLRTDFLFIGVSLAVALLFIAGHNVMTPDQPTKIGYVEVSTSCVGIDAGVCLGIEKRSHTTYNYDDYEKPEVGTENYYRKVEAELMIRAYNTCTSEMSGMDWVSEVSYEDKTAEEWAENENIDLLPCEQTFYRNMSASK